MPKFHLAQLNIAYAKAPIDSPDMADFVNQLDEVNQLAEDSPGFIWRLQTDDGNATDIRVFEDENVIVNMSIWDSLGALKEYVYSGRHLDVLKDKKRWFDKMSSAHMVLWWIPEGHTPDLDEALLKLGYLNEYGPTPEAFTFSKPFEPV